MAIPKFPELETKILKDWKDQQIFKKTMDKPSPKGEFVFYDGPPTANGMPHIGHVETRAFKDIIPRFKTMQGYRVERKAGWDTQGLPVELEVEKQLGLSGKKDIEAYGIEQFNAKAKESVWKYKDLWEKMTERVGFWLDTDHPYITYQPEYIETLWWIFRQVWDKKLLIQDYKVVPYCPRCGTALSSHEVAQGYKKVPDTSVYVKFELVDEPGTYVLAWTTTPWTLPGNVALAVDKDIDYVKIRYRNNKTNKEERYILAEKLVQVFFYNMPYEGVDYVSLKKGGIGSTGGVQINDYEFEITNVFKGSELVGKKYQPLFDFLDLAKESGKKAYYIADADFVTTEDGTGVVHTAVMYGEDDFKLGQKLDLPKVHTVDEQGKFNQLVKPWVGWEVKDPEEKTQRAVIQYLAEHNKLYKEEKYEHDYPFCWRCKHPLLYYAKTSWFIQMSKLREQLIKMNGQIHWYPNHIQEGRFGEWLREVKDWAISRERYWGTPIPIWRCDACDHQVCLGSYEELIAKAPKRNRYIFIRHGESQINVDRLLNTVPARKNVSPLTSAGTKQAERAAKQLAKEGVDVIYSSEFQRALETATIIGDVTQAKIIEDARINEFVIGETYEGKPLSDYHQQFPTNNRALRFHQAPPGGETWFAVRQRMMDFLRDIDARHENATIVVVSHEVPIMVADWAIRAQPTTAAFREDIENCKLVELPFSASLYRPDGTFDPHRPFIDQVTWECKKCSPSTPADGHPSLGRRGVMRRIPEVADAWFDSGSMPLAQWHYPFEHEKKVDDTAYPADYISEAIDQTRGWFYTLVAVATLLGRKEPPFKNVVVLGHLNDAQGKKLSKSLGNYVDPMQLIDQYGADALRWFLYTANQPWDPKNFDTKLVDEGVKKTFLILMNVVSFWQLYHDVAPGDVAEAKHPLDRWVLSEMDALIEDVTKRLEQYDITGAARAIASFVTELSTWYVRRSRDRFKSDEAPIARAALTHVLQRVATLLAPFTPFLAEHVYRVVGGARESVHLEDWPTAGKIDERLRSDMATARLVAEQGHALRAQAGIKVRQPLHQVVTLEQLRPDLDGIVRDELNVKEVVTAEKLPDGNEWVAGERVALDTTVTDELKLEGMYRDLVREFNALRKTAKLQPSDTVTAFCQPNTTAAKVIEHFAQQFLTDVRAKAVTPSLDGAEHTAEIELDGQKVNLGVAKV